MDQQNGQSEEAVMAMFGEWREEEALKEEPINIDELLQSSTGQGRVANSAVQSQAPSTASSVLMHQSTAQDYNMAGVGLPQKVPTFSSSANRPSVLDLSTTAAVKSEYGDNGQQQQQRMNMNGHQQQQQRAASPHQQQSPHSPHQRSPYAASQQVFNYNNNAAHQEQQSPMSPHAPQQLHSPLSPHQRSVSPHQQMMSDNSQQQQQMSMNRQQQMSPHPQMSPAPPPLSPHSPYANRSASPHSEHNLVIASPVSPHGMPGSASPHHPGMQGQISPHHMAHGGSVSPVPRQFSPTPGASSVFGRYAGSPVSMHSGNSSDTDSYYSYSPAQIAEMRKRGINVDKGSDIYKAKRERNNVAVRKSREKKKQREQETEKRVKELSDENGALQNKLDIALKEMNLLKNLYKNIGVQLPAEVRDKLENELSKFK